MVFGGIQGTPATDPGAGVELPLPVIAPQTTFGLLISDGSGLPATPFGAGGMSPAWLPDGRLLALGNQVVPGGGSDLLLRLVDRDGTVSPLEKLGIRVSGPTTYAARWDLPHRRLLVLVNRPDAEANLQAGRAGGRRRGRVGAGSTATARTRRGVGAPGAARDGGAQRAPLTVWA